LTTDTEQAYDAPIIQCEHQVPICRKTKRFVQTHSLPVHPFRDAETSYKVQYVQELHMGARERRWRDTGAEREGEQA